MTWDYLVIVHYRSLRTEHPNFSNSARPGMVISAVVLYQPFYVAVFHSIKGDKYENYVANMD